MTFCVLAPEHPLVSTIKKSVPDSISKQISEYQSQAKSLSDMDRQATTREKTGVFTGAYAINPANGKRVKIFIADYVMMGYGTGAIMAVPAHDQRDFDFAAQFNLDVVPVFAPEPEYLRAFPGKTPDDYIANPKDFSPVFETKGGVLINSGEYTGMDYETGAQEMGNWIVALGIGDLKVNYKIRDWLISRQRYWGCPIPVIYDKEGNIDIVSDSALPVELPEVENYAPGDDGSSPLAHIPEFLNATTSDGTLGKRETDTMGGFACSSWYFLRFCDPHNEERAWDPEKTNYWMPVDCYVGGAEHAVMHLLYARFWTKVLYDLGLVNVKEPFKRLMNQGQVLGHTPYRQAKEGETLSVGEDGILLSFEDAAKLDDSEVDWRWVRMSKSKGNVVTPEEAVENYGSDALRVYELFVAPFEQNVQWSNDGMQGAVRFLSRVFKFSSDVKPHYDSNWKPKIEGEKATDISLKIRRITHQFIEKATSDIERFAFNTYVSSAMSALNAYNDILKNLEIPSEAEKLALSEAIYSFVMALSPMAPHSADEIYEYLGYSGFTYQADWPKHDESLTKEDTVTIAIQVNGKLRDTIEMPAEATKEEIESVALARERVAQFTSDLTVRKVIVVPGKLVNVVAN